MEPDEQQLEEREKRLLQAYKQVFESPNGKAVLEDLKNVFYNRTSLDENPNVVVANEGKRFVVLYILARMDEANVWRERRESYDADSTDSTN